jgi:hypothetical protein
MKGYEWITTIAGTIGVTITGITFFFAIIGVFGLRAAVISLLVYFAGTFTFLRVKPAEEREP